MIIESLLTYLFFIAIGVFLLRWSINWVILNRINKTNYSPFRGAHSIGDVIPFMKHVAISEWQIWWKGDDFKGLKRYSNIFSCGLYISIMLVLLLLMMK